MQIRRPYTTLYGLHPSATDVGIWSANIPIAALCTSRKVSLLDQQLKTNVARSFARAPEGALRRGTPHLVCFRAEGRLPPLILISGAEGHAMTFRDIASRLGPEQPVYGLQLPGTDVGEPLVEYTVEEMAAIFEHQVLGVVPGARAFLGGFSMGAGVAAELASRLLRRGLHVLGLVSVDGFSPGFYRDTKPVHGHLWAGLRGVTSDVRALLSSGRIGPFEIGPRNRLAERRSKRLDVLRQRAVVRHQLETRLPLSLLLVLAAHPLSWLKGRPYAADYGWSDCIEGSVSSFVVDGQHSTLLQDPTCQRMIATAVTSFVHRYSRQADDQQRAAAQ